MSTTHRTPLEANHEVAEITAMLESLCRLRHLTIAEFGVYDADGEELGLITHSMDGRGWTFEPLDPEAEPVTHFLRPRSPLAEGVPQGQRPAGPHLRGA